MGQSKSWRPAVAALVNDELRVAYARIVLGEQNIDRAVRARLLQAGLITLDHDTIEVDVTELRAVLASDAGPGRTMGPQRYLTIDGAIDRYPAEDEDRRALVEYIAERIIATGDTISADELNLRLAPWDGDLSRMRRMLVDYGFLTVSDDGTQYSR